MSRTTTAREILGDDDFEYLQQEINDVLNNPEIPVTEKYIDIEQLMNDWGIEPDYMDEFL